MDQSHSLPYLREIVVFLVAAGILVPLLHRFRISPVLGYLLVGGVIGPFGLGLLADLHPWVAQLVIADIEGVRRLAELGVIFLLFMIGLELSFERLWALRRYVFGLGSLQILISGIVIGLIASGFGNSAASSAILGACLALSSTAIVMQLLAERHALGTTLGRSSFSILLMQDLAVVPILFLVGVLGSKASGSIGLSLAGALAKAAGVIVAIYLLGRMVLRPLLRQVARTRSPEMFMAAILLIAIGSSALTGAAGLSMALGAFLAGLLLAETEYRHRVEVDIEPFKGLLLGLFFMSVGMGIDYRVLATDALWIVASVAGLIAIKSVITALLCLAFGLPRHIAVETGLLLGQGGEFAFVVIGLAVTMGVIGSDIARFMLIVAGLSMLLTPVIAVLAKRLAHWLNRSQHQATEELAGDVGKAFEGLEGHVIIVGFGRVGRLIARILESERRPWLAFDLDVENVTRAHRQGMPVYFGDAARIDLLERANIQQAAALVVTTDHHAAANQIVTGIRAHTGTLPIYARARDRDHARHLLTEGATEVVPETVEASLQLAARVLEGLGTPAEAVSERVQLAREAELAPLRSGP
jgi:CPA2 family monovalent cation:H+ antiporter-2